MAGTASKRSAPSDALVVPSKRVRQTSSGPRPVLLFYTRRVFGNHTVSYPDTPLDGVASLTHHTHLIGTYCDATVPVCENCKKVFQNVWKRDHKDIACVTAARILASLLCGMKFGALVRERRLQSSVPLVGQECGVEKTLSSWVTLTFNEVRAREDVIAAWNAMYNRLPSAQV